MKGLAYYIISKLNKETPSRRFKEERIRIHLQVWANIQNHEYRLKSINMCKVQGYMVCQRGTSKKQMESDGGSEIDCWGPLI